MSILSKDRIYYFDNLKFFLILLVVMGHFLGPFFRSSRGLGSIYLFAYSFHMPLFIFVSGFFHKNKKIFQKFLFFIIIGLLLKTSCFALYNIFGSEVEFLLLSEWRSPWYMFVLADYIVISYLLRNADKRIVFIVSIILGCLIGYTNVGDFLCLSRAFVFYPFYVLGEMVTQENIIKLTRCNWLKLFAVIIIVSICGIYFFYFDKSYKLIYFFSGKNAFANISWMKDIYCGVGYRLLCYFIASILSFACMCLTVTNKIHIISKFGTRTLQIYFWNPIVICILQQTPLFDYAKSSVNGELLWLLISIITTFILGIKIFGIPIEFIRKICMRKYMKVSAVTSE